MEFLLLWADEIDDAMGALRHLAPGTVVSIMAAIVFATTVVGVIMAPQITLAICGLGLSASLVGVVRRRPASPEAGTHR